MSLPGYIRDPDTGRYFRERPGDPGNRSLKKIKRKLKSKSAVKVRPSKVSNVLDYLKLKEIGSVKGVNAESEFCKIKAHFKKEVYHDEMNTSYDPFEPDDVESVEFITGGQESMFGMWNTLTGSEYKYILMEKKYHNSDLLTMGYKELNCSVVDLCESQLGIIICIYHDYFKNISTLHYFRKNSEYQTVVNAAETLYCCTALGDGFQHAAGAEHYIKFFSGNNFEYFINLKGRVCTLSAVEDGTFLTAGLHNGKIHFYDIRTYQKTGDVKKLGSSIVQSAFHEGTPYAIFSGLSNDLFSVDVRMNKIVAKYFGHSQSSGRRHFSFGHNMLCATGADNIIRLWHTSGGSPIHEIEPIINPENNIRGWLNSDGNKTYLNYFEADCTKVFEIL